MAKTVKMDCLIDQFNLDSTRMLSLTIIGNFFSFEKSVISVHSIFDSFMNLKEIILDLHELYNY